MDLGVGSVVFSGALVSQAARNASSTSGSSSLATSQRIWKMVSSSIPLFVLAIVRMVSVWGVDYQTHVSEYGVHWNFFCTLALVGIFVNLMDIAGVTGRNSSPRLFLLLGACIATLQQLALSFGGMYDFVMHAERVNLVSANKEGICTVAGYLSIYYIGVGVGKFIFSCRTRKHWIRLSLYMTLSVVLLWILQWIALERSQAGIMAKNTGKDMHYDQWIAQQPLKMHRVWQAVIPSRRILNIGYIIWVITYNLSLLCCLLIVDCCTLAVPADELGRASKEQKKRIQPRLSIIAQSISQNQLLTFLVANLLTGAVNIFMETIFAGSVAAMTVLIVYLFLTMSISAALRNKKYL